MKKHNFLFILALLIGLSSSAQLSSGDYSKHYANLMNTKNKAEELQGSPYLFDEWAEAVVVFNDEKGGNFDQVKIDLMNNQLEFLYMNTEKVLPASEFDIVRIIKPGIHDNTYFHQASKFKYNNKALSGFAQVTPVGEDYQVIVAHTIRVIQPNMNAKIVGANHRKRVAKEHKTFISKKGKLYRIKKKKDLYKILTKKQRKLKVYINDHDLGVKKDIDLIQILEFYTSL